jgi:hypothetical protein
MNLAIILSIAAAILWFVALALWLRGGARRPTPDQPQHQVDDQRA